MWLLVGKRENYPILDTVEEASGSDVQTQMHKKVRISNQIFRVADHVKVKMKMKNQM